ncbi:hypothetical protein DDZ14_08375 [Maritimibacter sp. 55A14]|uniref:hypothetical protein n=1 Tax=Maritimibacter sp. 55A14 TaxID=2174844 RepID=UPI000D61E874|nr:hypothetical protein [Maritimibacter sp. 55A14]PWE32752.1 hypothetical protein DDZ14_08375 [Maritimibacter sp. 55A14]
MPCTDTIARLLADLSGRGPEDAAELLANAVMESGGIWAVPPGTGPGPAMVEISLHAITGHGPDRDAAVASWTKAASTWLEAMIAAEAA